MKEWLGDRMREKEINSEWVSEGEWENKLCNWEVANECKTCLRERMNKWEREREGVRGRDSERERDYQRGNQREKVKPATLDLWPSFKLILLFLN